MKNLTPNDLRELDKLIHNYCNNSTNSNRKSCLNKIFHVDEHAANIAKQTILREQSKFTRSYKCDICPGWHLTTQIKRVLMTEEQQAEYDFLYWFYCNSDFGPADGDVRSWLKQRYVEETGKPIPEGYQEEE